MLRFVAILATLAVANGFSVYSLPECFSPNDLNIINQAPLCGAPAQLSCLQAPQTVCLPANVAAPVGPPNTNAIITLLAALKSAGIIPDPAAPPPPPPAQDTNSLLALKVLNLLSLVIGGSAPPANGTAPIDLSLLSGPTGSPLILIELLNGLLGGGAPAAPAPPATPAAGAGLQTLLLSLLGSLAAPPAASPCPAGTVPVAVSNCPAPAPRCA